MAIMRAVDAAMHVLEKEGSPPRPAPGAAINLFYDEMRRHGGIKHYLARHVEGASHMAEVTLAPPPATSACASALPARRAPT